MLQKINEQVILELLATVPDYTYQFDTKDEFIRIFPTANDLLGIASTTHSGSFQWWAENVHEDDIKAQEKYFHEWVDGGCEGVLYRKYRFRDKNNNFYLIEDRTKSVLDSGKTGLFVGCFTVIEPIEKLQKRLSIATDNLPAVIFEYERLNNGNSRFPYVSNGIISLLGIHPNQINLSAEKFFQCLHIDDLSRLQQDIQESAEMLAEWQSEFRTISDGKISWFKLKAKPQISEDMVKWQGLFYDITAEKMLAEDLQANQRMLSMAQEIAGIGSWRITERYMDVLGSDIFFKTLGFSDDRKALPFEDFVHLFEEREQKRLIKSFKNAIVKDTAIGITLKLQDSKIITLNGNYIEDTSFVGWMGIIKDVSEQVFNEEKLKHVASIDELTGAFNRRYLLQYLKQLSDKSSISNFENSLIVFDVDKFKSINDTYGHIAGDQVLQKLVQIVKSHLRKHDLIARLGGEEFVIFLEGTNPSTARAIAENIRITIASSEIDIGPQVINITATFGIAGFKASEVDFKEIIKRADIAMYKGKAEGRNNVQLSH